MKSSRRVAETVPQISVSSIKNFVSRRNSIVELTLTDIDGNQWPYFLKTTARKCYFGNSRPWFKCVLCDKRVGVLYLNESGTDLFCRKCSRLRYRSQVTGGSTRLLMRYFDADERAEAAFGGLERVTFLYKNKPTRRFQRFLKNRHKSECLSRYFSMG
jgi:hypothetical protein